MSDLLVRLKLDDRGLDAQLKGVSSKFKSAAKGIAAISLPVAAIAGIVKAVDALAAMGAQAIEAAGSLQDTSEQLGVTAERLQELRLVAKNAGVDIEGFDKSLSVLNRTLGQAALGQGAFEKIAKSVGISIRTEQGGIKDTAAVWDLLTAKIQSGALTQNQAIGLASAAFGREGGKMVAVLRQTAEEQQKVIDTARRFGAIISNELVKSADEYGDQLELINKGTEALSIQTKLMLAPLTLWWAEAENAASKYVAALFGVKDAQIALTKDSIATVQADIKHFEDEIAKGNHGGNVIQDAFNFDQEGVKTFEEEVAKRKAMLLDLQHALAEQQGLIPDFGNRKKPSESAATPAADPSMLQAIDVAAQKIEVERSFQQMVLDVQKEAQIAQLDQAIEVDAQRIEATRSWQEIELQMAAQHEGLLTQAHREGVEARIEFSKMEAGEKVASVVGSLQEITAGVAQYSKKAFELNKLAAIANAIINTAQGATKALAQGGFFGIAMAATVIAAGAAQIAAIRKTTFQGGGQGTTPSAVGTTPVVNSQPVGQGAGGGSNSTIRVEGINSNSLFTGRSLRELLERLQEAQKDGGKLVIVGT